VFGVVAPQLPTMSRELSQYIGRNRGVFGIAELTITAKIDFRRIGFLQPTHRIF